MDTTNELTQDLLHELFEYRDGVLYWKVAKANNIKVGDDAGYLSNHGYLNTKINKKIYLNHRLIFLMHHGYLPKCLDHIDGNRLNNRIENLRPASHFENNYNSKIRKDSTSGFKGVNWDARSKRWKIQLKVNGKLVIQKYYKTIEEAVEAIKKAREELHGEFARHE